MNSTESFEQFWIDSGYQLTLGEILNTHFAAEYRKHISLLRPKYQTMGYQIKCQINRKEPGKNLYIRAPLAIPADENGQYRLFRDAV